MSVIPPQDQNFLRAQIWRLEERYAVLRHENFGELRWPVRHIPVDAQVGDTVYLKASTEKEEEDEKYTRMRKLLEEMIN